MRECRSTPTIVKPKKNHLAWSTCGDHVSTSTPAFSLLLLVALWELHSPCVGGWVLLIRGECGHCAWMMVVVVGHVVGRPLQTVEGVEVSPCKTPREMRLKQENCVGRKRDGVTVRVCVGSESVTQDDDAYTMQREPADL